MMIRWKIDEILHERHYFFCITGTTQPMCSRHSICQSWLALKKLDIFPRETKFIYDFHDGGTNEYNNSTGLLLYATLQKMWGIKFFVHAFESYRMIHIYNYDLRDIFIHHF
jgi:hypothetical protein